MAERPIEIPVDIKAGNKSGLDLIQATADQLGRARKAIADTQAQGGIKKIIADRESEDLNKATESAARLAARLLEIRDIITNTVSTSDNGFQPLIDEAAQLEEQLKQVAVAASTIPDALPKAEKQQFGGERLARPIQSIAGLTQAAGAVGLVDQKGAAQLGQGVQFGGDIARVIENLPKFGNGIREFAGALADAPGLIGTVSGGLTSALIPSLGATGAAVASVAIVAAPLILILAGIAVALHGIQQSSEDGKKAAQDYNSELERQVKIQRQIADFKASGDLEGFHKAQQDFLKQQQDANTELTGLYQKRSDLDTQYAALGSDLNANARQSIIAGAAETDAKIKDIYENQFTPATKALEDMGAAADDVTKAASERKGTQILIDGINQRIDLENQYADTIRTGNTGALAERKKAIEDELTAIQDHIGALAALAPSSEDAAAALQKQTDKANGLKNELSYLNDITGETTKNINNLAAAQKAQTDALVAQVQTQQDIANLIKGASTDALKQRSAALTAEFDAINKVLPELQALAPTSKDAAAQLDTYQKRLIAINNQMTELSAALPDVRAAEVAKGLNEIADAEKNTDRKIEDIRAASLESLANIETAHTDAILKAGDKRLAALKKSQADEESATSKVNKEYMDSELKANQKFHDDEIKAGKAASKERLKILDDTYQNELDATAANDVIAFIRAQREGEKKLKDEKETVDQAAQDRKAAYLEERQQARENREKALADIKAQGEASRAAAEDEFKTAQHQADQAQQDAIDRQKKGDEERIAAEETSLLQRISAIQDNYHLEESLIDDIFAKRKTKYTEDDKIINERLDLALKRHAEDLDTKAKAETDSHGRIVTTKSNAEQKAAGDTANYTARAYGQAAVTIGAGLTGLVTSLAVAIAAAKTAAAGSLSGAFGGTGSGGGSSSGGAGAGTAFANEGIVRKPTLALIGEKLKPGQYEAVMKFDSSQGLPRGGDGGTVINIGDIDLSGSELTAPQVKEAIYDAIYGALDGTKAARLGKKS
jgi:hypothetical protein